MSNPTSVLKLHLTKRMYVFGVPASILGLVIAITVLITVGMARFGVDTSSAEYLEGIQHNFGVLWSLPGFLIYLGVQAVSTTFPFGMSLGTTRRSYSLGTSLYFALQSAYIAALAVALYGIELLTGHWFLNAYVFDINALGNGNVFALFATIFTLVFFSMSMGGLFGALYVKAGSRGPLILAIALALTIVLLLVILAPNLAAIIGALTRWWVLGVALALSIAAVIGEYLALRTASVR